MDPLTPRSSECKRRHSATECFSEEFHCVPSYLNIPTKKFKHSSEAGCEYDLLEALEHQKRVHMNLMHRVLQYRAGVGLYKRKMQQFHESLDEVEKKAFRAIKNTSKFGESKSYWRSGAKYKQVKHL